MSMGQPSVVALTRVQRFGTESLQQGLFCPAQA
jgi:hypothetical protein